MKNNKPWYEKIYIWIGIVAGIFAILGVSVFDNISLSKNTKANDEAVNYESDENEPNSIDLDIDGNKNVIIAGDIGGDININKETLSESVASPEDETLEFEGTESDEYSVTTTYDMNTSQTSLSGIDIMVKAKTSFSADHVTISAKPDDGEITDDDIYNMHGGTYEWYFKANFYIKGKYTVKVTAYNSEGESVSDEFIYVY